ncbi:MAG: CoA transferase [Chloroflexi bacterium]|nr:CoA transferase [Chloroflexota bacterium]
MTRPLTGVRVLELTTAVAGPIAGCALADLGAEVIKIESPAARTTAGAAAPPPREGAPDRPWNRTPVFNDLHRGKRLLNMDLAHREGRALFLRLVAQSDVVVENFSPRVLANLGIDYPQLREARGDVILVSMPAFGKSGPYALRGSYGPGIDAMSGLSHLTGYPDRGPGKPAQFYCDFHAGLTAAFATMAALRHRRRTGEGQYIELSMLEGELQLLAPALMDVTMNGRSATRIGNRHAWRAPQGVYACAGDDRWVAITVTTDAQWAALARALGHPEIAEDARYATHVARMQRHDEIDALIAAWTRGRGHVEAMHALQAAGVPAGALLDVAELHRDPQLLHREAFSWQEHAEMGAFPHSRLAWRSRRGHHGVSGPAPLYGEANAYAIRELLGESAERVEALREDGVIADEPRGGRH